LDRKMKLWAKNQK